MTLTTIDSDLVQWLAGGERGASSNAIVQHVTGYHTGSNSHPYDPDDLYRCIKLLNAAPWLRERFSEMKSCSAVWARLVERWDELEMTFYSELADSGGRKPWKAPKTYALMREILEHEKL
jgi:hypothetical protein